MYKLLLTVAAMLMPLVAVAQDMGASQPAGAVGVVQIAMFALAFFGLIAWFCFRVWQNERRKKAVATQG